MKHCKRCKKIIRRNITGYCRHCYKYLKNKERRIKLRKEKRCNVCCKKVEPKYPFRCDECNKRAKELLKKGNKDLNTKNNKK